MLTRSSALLQPLVCSLIRRDAGSVSLRKARRFLATVLLINLLAAPLQPVIADPVRGVLPGSLNGVSNYALQQFGNVNSLFGFAFQQSNDMPERPSVAQAQPIKPPATKAEKEARVASIRLNMNTESWVPSKQRFIAGAIPLDKDGNAVHGLAAEWTTSDRMVVFINKSGMAVAGKPGTAKLTAQAGNKRESITINVFDDGRTRSSLTAGGRKSPTSDKMVALAQKRKVSFAHAPMPAGTDDRLPDTETSSLYDPKNDVGKPEGRTEAAAQTSGSANSATETPGSANYTFGVPLVGIPGRQLNAPLGLTYNSRVWHKVVAGSTTKMYFDVDAGWPAAGFRLGYGQIEHQGTSGFTLTEPDGTRREMVSIGTTTPLAS